MNKRVGYVYLDEIHHIHHFLSSAVALSQRQDCLVDILTYQSEHAYLRQLLNAFPGNKVNLVTLSTYRYRRILERLKKRKQPSAYYIYRKHLAKFLSYDALVFTDHTAGYIARKRVDKLSPQLILLGHGAGDGAYGYKDSHNDFDLVIVSGRKKFDRLSKAYPNASFKIAIGGYGKFDVVGVENNAEPPFDNRNTTVLYNPHFKEHLSSWYINGTAILDFFATEPNYNLIFAPHLNLFHKEGLKNDPRILDKYRNCTNILIDTGSVNLVNMSYVKAADIYLGDVSSQIYEFLLNPRPAVFINSHNIDWKENADYQMWLAGQVITEVEELKNALSNAENMQDRFLEPQNSLLNETFSEPGAPAGPRIAGLIYEFLQ